MPQQLVPLRKLANLINTVRLKVLAQMVVYGIGMLACASLKSNACCGVEMEWDWTHGMVANVSHKKKSTCSIRHIEMHLARHPFQEHLVKHRPQKVVN